jgi:hypothetical protein
MRELAECEACGGEGVDGHDCGEDSRCCVDPEPNVTCRVCGGSGAIWVDNPVCRCGASVNLRGGCCPNCLTETGN